MKEFQALGLDMTVLDGEGNFVDMKDLEATENDGFLTLEPEELESVANNDIEEEPEEEYDDEPDFGDDFDQDMDDFDLEGDGE